MSRYYKIVVGQETAVPVGQATASGNLGATWTNQVGGKADLGAQMVELDLWATEFDAPAALATVTIWGPSKAQISQASDFNGAPIQIYAGMQNGLPLATAAVSDGQAGLLLSGTIFQSFGNYQGLSQNLVFVIQSSGLATQSQPGNYAFLWNRGEPMGQVIERTLKIANPQFQINVNIDPNLILTQDESGVYYTLTQFATYCRGVSQDIIGGDYSGVSMTMVDNTINVFDSNTAYVSPPKKIKTQDMIGAVTWLDIATISFSTIMRADLQVGSIVTFPPLAGQQAITTPSSGSNARAQGTFTGNWQINYMRHVGNSRAPGAQGWVSTFKANSLTANPAAVSVGDSSA